MNNKHDYLHNCALLLPGRSILTGTEGDARNSEAKLPILSVQNVRLKARGHASVSTASTPLRALTKPATLVGMKRREISFSEMVLTTHTRTEGHNHQQCEVVYFCNNNTNVTGQRLLHLQAHRARVVMALTSQLWAVRSHCRFTSTVIPGPAIPR